MPLRRTFALSLVLAVAALAWPRPARSCSLCGDALKQMPTFRQEASKPLARMILYGAAHKPRIVGTKGVTDLLILDKLVLRPDPALKGKTSIELQHYLAVSDEKNPPKYLVFCDVADGKIDPYRGEPVKGPGAFDYLKKALALDAKDKSASLAFFFRYLDNADPKVAQDAFLEFAKSNDAEVSRAARKLSPEKLRAWLKDADTPSERIGLYAMLLGACGKGTDAAFLRDLLDRKDQRFAKAADGILAGYVHLEPKKGWELVLSILADGRKPLGLRLCAVRTLRFYHGAQPNESRVYVLKGQELLLRQGELADIAVSDLCQWKMWDLTREVLAVYGKKGYDAPLMQRAILRYALSCPATAESRAFLAGRRTADADLVKEVEESLRLEREG